LAYGVSLFEFRPTKSFQYIQGYLIWTMQEKQVSDTVLDCWSHTQANLGVPFKLTKCHGHSYQPLYCPFVY